MALKLFNTLSRSIQEFTPLDPAGKKVGMYCCGPTVYDFAHIGNWRTFVFGDLVRRTLEFKGYAVTHVMNITDVEDKIIKRVRLSRQSGTTADENKTSLREFTSKYEAAFFEDLKTLNCLLPHHTPHATEHIADIIALIEKLIARGIAYKAADGSVYFSIEKYRGCGCNYGQLLKLNFDEMRAGERVKSDEYAKESVADFALWKARVPEDGDVFWKSESLGEGRPGWHIECSAMSMKVLGESFDLHLGGEDLIFPHHEDEIAQSEGATGKPFVKHWLHGAHLLVEGKKMSKSLGNFFTLRDLLNRPEKFRGSEIRYLLLTAHYRETFNFTIEGLLSARAALARIKECLEKLVEFLPQTSPEIIHVDPDIKIINQFTAALDDDLNVSKAWGVIFGWIRDLNRRMSQKDFSSNQAAVAIGTWKILDLVLGLNFEIKSPARVRDNTAEMRGIVPFTGFAAKTEGEEQLPHEIQRLVIDRMQAKKAKDFKRADAIRGELKAKGWVIEDTAKGPKLKKI
jgi:cysteinyl-tRNA synthetase